MPAPPWPECDEVNLYQVLHEPQTAWQDSQATQPWSLHCTDDRREFQAGSTLEGRLSLFGPWPDWAIDAWRDIFAAGIAAGLGEQRCPAQLQSMELRFHNGTNAGIPSDAVALRLSTCGPCHLQDNRSQCTTLNACAIARSLLRRAAQLHRQLMGSELIDAAAYRQHRNDAANLCGSVIASKHSHIPRLSQRQGRHRMPGLEGCIVIHGSRFAHWAPLLAQAPLLLIGNKPSFGFGQVELEWLNETQRSEIDLHDTRDATKDTQ